MPFTKDYGDGLFGMIIYWKTGGRNYCFPPNPERKHFQHQPTMTCVPVVEGKGNLSSLLLGARVPQGTKCFCRQEIREGIQTVLCTWKSNHKEEKESSRGKS